MCIHKLPYDHGFAQKHPKSVFNAPIKFYSHKRDAMVNFWRWYFLRSILHDFTIKVTLRSSKFWGAQKLCFGDLPLCLCGPRENFLCELPTPNMYCKTSSWSWLHAETNRVNVTYFNAMICPKTWADGHFLDFIPSQRRLEGKLDWKKLRQLCVFGGVFEIQTSLENFLDFFTPWCGYLKSSLRVGLYAEEKIRVIRHSNQKLSTKTKNWH